jgi:hypothetical protein
VECLTDRLKQHFHDPNFGGTAGGPDSVVVATIKVNERIV